MPQRTLKELFQTTESKLSYGSFYCFFCIPFISKYSLMNDFIRYFVNFRKFCNAIFNSINIEVFVVSHISTLHFSSRPPTVFFRIISIIINPINRGILFSKLFYMKLIRFIHIISKFFKRLPKTFNSSTAIRREIRQLLITSSRYNATINSIKSCMFKSVFVVHDFISQKAGRFASILPSVTAKLIIA